VTEPYEVRDAAAGDMHAVREIYNALIPTTTIAWTEERETVRSRMTWFRAQQRAGNPVLVVEQSGVVVGFASYAAFRGEGRWPGYRHTVEHTIHVSQDHWGRGLGRQLLQALTERARAADVHVMVAAVDAENDESITFHERVGFSVVGRMPEVGRKFDRWLDLVLMQRIL
jgi:L-amino acid N-acyltransferase YncA